MTNEYSIEDSDVTFTPQEWSDKIKLEIPNSAGWTSRFSVDTGFYDANNAHILHIFHPRPMTDRISAYEFMCRLQGSMYPN